MGRKSEKDTELQVTKQLNSALGNISLKDLLEGGAIPSKIDSEEKLLTIVQAGSELGLEPVTALANIHLIKGKMVVSAAILGALMKKHGYEWIWTKDFRPSADDPENIETEVEIFWFSKSLKREMSTKHSITWNQMSLAGYTSKDNWDKMPKEMMRARCLSSAVRAIAPEVLLGKYVDIEMVDSLEGTGKKIDIDTNGELKIVEDSEYTEI